LSDLWIIPIAIAGFAAFWCGIVWLIATVGGWHSLARVYRSQLPFSGHTWRFRSGRMGGFAKYNGVLTVGVNSAGLYLAVFPLFRPGHPPLFIPWHDITVSSERRFIGTFVVFTFRQAPNASLALWEPFGREVLERARG
jgi:hypothetical protein